MSLAACLLALSGTITLPAFGHLTYKIYLKRRNPGFGAATVACFALTSVCTYLALQGLTLGFVYASASITQVLILFFGWRFLGERVSGRQVLAILMISTGVLLFAAGSF